MYNQTVMQHATIDRFLQPEFSEVRRIQEQWRENRWKGHLHFVTRESNDDILSTFFLNSKDAIPIKHSMAHEGFKAVCIQSKVKQESVVYLHSLNAFLVTVNFVSLDVVYIIHI